MRLLLAAAGFGLAFFASAAMAQAARTIDLPAALSYPEGVAYDPDSASIFTAGALDGTVVKLNARTGQSQVLVKAGVLFDNSKLNLFPAFLGMKLDSRKRLWIAGGRAQNVYVVDSSTGATIKSMTLPGTGTGSVLNDLVVTSTHVYVTDTFRPYLWRVPVNGDSIGNPEPWLDWTGIAEFGTSPNMNGIAVTPDGRTLFVVHMTSGALYKIDTATKAVVTVNLGGADITSGDGLVLDGNRLHVVRQAANEVATIELSPDMASGKVVSRFTHPSLSFLATAARAGDELIVVSTQFNRRGTNDPVRPFRLTAVPVSLLGGK